MNRGGIGVGSASILLIFTVLCLAVFAMISFSTASTDRAMTDSWEKTVQEYYDADLLAEQILSEILAADKMPGAVLGIDLVTEADSQAKAVTVTYYVPVSEAKQLCVRVSLSERTYEVLEWRVLNTGEWDAGGGMTIWLGD